MTQTLQAPISVKSVHLLLVQIQNLPFVGFRQGCKEVKGLDKRLPIGG